MPFGKTMGIFHGKRSGILIRYQELNPELCKRTMEYKWGFSGYIIYTSYPGDVIPREKERKDTCAKKTRAACG
jgi:hypothetical protein